MLNENDRVKTREDALKVLVDAMDDETFDMVAYANSVLSGDHCVCVVKSNISIRNSSGVSIRVSISKTCGEGQDRYFTVEPMKWERWSRCVYRVVTITNEIEPGVVDKLQYTVQLGDNNNELHYYEGKIHFEPFPW